MATEGDARPNAPDNHDVAPEDEVSVLNWYGTIQRGTESENAVFAATNLRLIYATNTVERVVEYSRIRSVETSVETDGDSAGFGYWDVVAGAIVFTVVGLGVILWSDHVIGSVVGIIGLLIGVLLAVDVLRNSRDRSGRMIVETPTHHIRLVRTDEEPLCVTTSEDVGVELSRLVTEAQKR